MLFTNLATLSPGPATSSTPHIHPKHSTSCREYVPEMQQKYVPTLLAGYRLWIPAHIVNFALVPNRQVGPRRPFGGLLAGTGPSGDVLSGDA